MKPLRKNKQLMRKEKQKKWGLARVKSQQSGVAKTNLTGLARMTKLGGFSMIELLLYIAIFGSVMILITGFFWNITLGYIKENSYEELQQNARFVLAKMTQEIKGANTIITPLPGEESDSLALNIEDSLKDPTIFIVRDGYLVMEQGGSSFLMTSDRAIVTSLRFQNLSQDNGAGAIRVEIDLSHLNPGNLAEYSSEINLATTISLPKEENN